MKTGFLRLILLAVSVLMTGAAPLAAQQKGQKVPNGVFFKIEKKGQQPSYALGTVHYVHGDYMHEIPGLDSILGTITCLASEMGMEEMIHPDQQATVATLISKLQGFDASKLEREMPAIIAEFMDTTKTDAYTRYLTPQQLDSLDLVAAYYQVNDHLASMLPVQGEKAYRYALPFLLPSLWQPLTMSKIVQFYKDVRGYTGEYKLLDVMIATKVNEMNEAYAAEHPDRSQPCIKSVGLDSINALNTLIDSQSDMINLILNDLSTKNLVQLIYRGGVAQYELSNRMGQIDSLYRSGKGYETMESTRSLPEAERLYANDVIVEGRNRYWMTQLPQLMKDHSTLIVVGLGHLINSEDSEGILSMLQKQGYKITKIL
ncbi:MAG: TraB/GumN family protein [Bacteroidaceae bacterium]|nr:TraB/GumN family protein [Bacteroidaceae bacterium]